MNLKNTSKNYTDPSGSPRGYGLIVFIDFWDKIPYNLYAKFTLIWYLKYCHSYGILSATHFRLQFLKLHNWTWTPQMMFKLNMKIKQILILNNYKFHYKIITITCSNFNSYVFLQNKSKIIISFVNTHVNVKKNILIDMSNDLKQETHAKNAWKPGCRTLWVSKGARPGFYFPGTYPRIFRRH